MSRLFSFLRTSKGRYVLFTLVAILAGWGWIRGCSHHSMFTQERYTVAIDKTWYPLALYGKEKNLYAFMDELLDAIGQESGLRFHVLEVGTTNLMQDLNQKNYDAVIAATPPVLMNRLKYRFSDSLYLVGPVLLVRTNSKIQSLDELTNRFVGIQRGSSLSFDTPFPDAKIVPYDSITTALAELEERKIDALIMDSMQAYVQIQGLYYTGKIKIVTAPLTQKGLRLITLDEARYNELFDAFDKALSSLKKNGVYEELLNRWGIFNPFISSENIK